MHGLLLLAMVALAWLWRWQWRTRLNPDGLDWTARWHQAIVALLLPPVLLLMTAVTILIMGTHGQMWGQSVGWIGYGGAVAAVGAGMGALGCTLVQGMKTAARLRQCLVMTLPDAVGGHRVRLLESSTPFAAQIGCWRPTLVISQGLLDRLSPDHIRAILLHEQAHYHYRDPVLFWVLGWVHRLSGWLPGADSLWQDLLLLREMRADAWAAQYTDPLLLAEALVDMVRHTLTPEDAALVGFSSIAPHRLTQRIDALLDPAPVPSPSWPLSLWYGALLLPWLTLGFHQ
jgi:Zn-dependent protease with chaperone function